MANMEIKVQGGQVLVAVINDDGVVLRVQKDGHNRGIAKLLPAEAKALAEAILAVHDPALNP